MSALKMIIKRRNLNLSPQMVVSSKKQLIFMKKGILKGSREEIALRYSNIDKDYDIIDLDESEDEMGEESQDQGPTNRVENPRYIVYDIETDIHTLTHKQNYICAQVMVVKNDHSYEKSLIETVKFDGYNCMNDFFNWLFDEKNKHSTVFAHNAAG
jgi:hypothetical protein